MDSRQQSADSRQQSADSRQQIVDTGTWTVDSRPGTGGNGRLMELLFQFQRNNVLVVVKPGIGHSSLLTRPLVYALGSY